MNGITAMTVPIVTVLLSLVCLAAGHGMVLDPVNRASRWRENSTAPANYEDTQLFCGGFTAQFRRNGGRCGLCGDDYAEAPPRDHELGGRPFGEGIIVQNYGAGAIVAVQVMITANHMGHFAFDLCNLDAGAGESEQCFSRTRLRLSGGAERYVLPDSREGRIRVDLQLPANLRCRHCVLRWTYVAGNSWGQCPDGSGAMGCGEQEHFRTCSDIAIL